jgi:hypothetical protein
MASIQLILGRKRSSAPVSAGPRIVADALVRITQIRDIKALSSEERVGLAPRLVLVDQLPVRLVGAGGRL